MKVVLGEMVVFPSFVLFLLVVFFYLFISCFPPTYLTLQNFINAAIIELKRTKRTIKIMRE